MQLNKMKPFGRISGEMFVPEGADKPAFYEQEGKFFDAHGNLLGAGATNAPADEEIDEAEITDEDMPAMTVAELLRQADSMNWRVFRQMAQKVLGPACPGTKAAMIEALNAAQVEFDARAARRAKERGAPPPPASNSGVDLAAWARGAREYLWADVRKAIKTEYGRNVSERDDAVEFLVTQQVVTAAQARKDVIREASGQ